jgi:SAM-dependent methyltransferase
MGISVDPALDAYESLAPAYDELTAGHDHVRWLGAIEDRLRAHGLRGRRLLDVGCGSGKSFSPMLDRGYDVTACDLSPKMVELARGRHPDGAARVHVADMRSLPELGRFDVVTCLDDAINYLLSADDLAAAFAGARGALADDGLYVFDVNTRATYARDFATASITERDDAIFCWRPRPEPLEDPETGREGLYSVAVDAFQRLPDGEWRRTTSVHVQRHHDREAVIGALSAAGLRCVAVLGQRPGGVLSDDADEARHTKLLYIARPRATSTHPTSRRHKEVSHDHRDPDRDAHRHPDRDAVGVLAVLSPPYGVRHCAAPYGAAALG